MLQTPNDISLQCNRNGLNILPSYTDYFSLTTTTLALNTSSVWLGGCVGGLFYGYVADAIGRKNAMLFAAGFTIFSAILQAASQNIAMFVIARIFIGFGTCASGVAGKIAILHTDLIDSSRFYLPG
jgi:MFS family permease